jgi:hypothetical protein
MGITRFGILRLDQRFQACPWDQLVHPAQELFLSRLTAFVTELTVGECELLIHGCLLDAVDGRHCPMGRT